MAITYPRDLPDSPMRVPKCRFTNEPIGGISRTAGGAVSFQETIGGSLWEALYVTGPLNETNWSRWHAWWMSLRGKSFKGYDPRRVWPLAYGPGVLNLTRAGGGAFDGTHTVTAVAGSTINLGNLPAGFVLTVGDYISFPYLGGQNLVKVLETVTANGSGVISGVTIAPWLRTGGTLPATGTMVRSWCEMRPKPGSWSPDREHFDPVSFEAIQTLSS